MPAVPALVNVLEFLYVQDYRSRIMDDNGYGLPVSTRPSDNALHCLSGLTLNAYQCLGFKLDVEPASAPWTVSEKLQWAPVAACPETTNMKLLYRSCCAEQGPGGVLRRRLLQRLDKGRGTTDRRLSVELDV